MRLDPWLTRSSSTAGLAATTLCAVLALGCGDKEGGDTGDGGGTGGGATDDTAASSDDTGGGSLPDALSECEAEDGAATEVNYLTVSGDELTVNLSYSGGCTDHDFVLCWPDQAFMESEPVQVDLELFHESYGDTCEAYPTEDRTFDLTPLKAAWQTSYGATSGEIVMHLGGESVTYRF